MREQQALGGSAADREDSLVYGEPPEWTVPVRHDLAEVLLASGRPDEAERVILEDLRRFPENAWSLRALAGAYRQQGEQARADEVMARFRSVWQGGASGTAAHQH